MHITTIQVYCYTIPFRQQLPTAHGTLTRREGALVEIRTNEDMYGIGEIAPLPTFSGPGLAEVLNLLSSSNLLQQFSGLSLSTALDLLYQAHIPASALSGLEMALLDALGQARHLPLSTLLSQSSSTPTHYPYTHIPVNAIIHTASIETAIQNASTAISAGFRTLKIKIGTTPDDYSVVQAIRNTVGPEVALRLDVNEDWDFATAHQQLLRYAPLAIQYIEQPLPAYDLEGMQRLRQISPIPIAADEAVSDLESARYILTHAMADILILKPQLIGGLAATQRIMHEAQHYHVPCVLTSALETGIGIAALAHLAAASPDLTLACGFATSHLLATDLLTDSLTIQEGQLIIPAYPGLGVQLNRSALAHYSSPLRNSL